MDDQQIDRKLDDLVLLLPEPLRADWAVLPRLSLYKMLTIGMFLGAAIALMITGTVLEKPMLTWAWPAAFFVLSFAAKFVPWWREDRFIDQLNQVRTHDGA